jgi:hypothetical protein
MSEVMVKYFNPDNLKLAYLRVVCWNDKTVKDRVGIRAFGINLEENCKALSKKICDNKYNPSRGFKFYVPKPSYTLRTKTLLYIEDAILYQAIANKIAEKSYGILKQQEQFVFGSVLNPNVQIGEKLLNTKEPNFFFFKFWQSLFQKFKESVIQSIEVDKVKYKFETDITGFFDCIPHYNLLEVLSSQFKVEDEILDILSNCLNIWSGTRDGITPGVGIPQGPVPSFLFANLLLHGLDEKIINKGLKYYRYMDDIKIYGYDETELKYSLIVIDKYLKSVGLSINSKKTSIEKIDEEKEDATIKELKKMSVFGSYDEIDFNIEDFIDIESIIPDIDKLNIPEFKTDPLERETAKLSDQEDVSSDFDMSEVEVLTDKEDIISYWERNINEVENDLASLFVDSELSVEDLELNEGVDDIDVIQLSSKYGTSLRYLSEVADDINPNNDLLKYWLFFYKKFFWRANNIGLTLVHYKDNKELKSYLIGLLSDGFQMYEWARYFAIQTLSFSQTFTDRELRSVFFNLLKDEEDLVKISIYRLLYMHSSNSQFESSINLQLKTEENHYLKLIVTDFKRSYKDDNMNLSDFINTIGL